MDKLTVFILCIGVFESGILIGAAVGGWVANQAIKQYFDNRQMEEKL
jgi:uncharacterized protein YneF (UPF0154 family)